MPLNPVALAALEALSGSESESESSSGISIDDVNANDDGMNNLDMDSDYELQNDNDIPYNDDDDDSPLKMVDYSPIKKEELISVPTKNNANSSGSSKKKRMCDCSKSNTSMDNIQNNNDNQYPLSHLKPFFDVGTAVYGPWWTGSVRQEFCDQWFPGTISSYKEVPTSSPYGPLRLYTIDYDDGDVLEDVHDHFVFSKEDYLLHDRSLRGVRCEAADTGFADDKWANVVGWYVVTIDGVDVQFARLADAMEAYDNHTIRQRGAKIQLSDLNRPEKYPELFASSEKRRRKKAPRSASSKTQSRSSPPHGLSSSASKSKTTKTNPLSNDLHLDFSSSSDSDLSARRRKRGDSRLTSTSQSSTSPKLKPRNQIEESCKPRSWQSSTLPSMTTTKTTTTPKSTPAPRNSLKKTSSDESVASAVTPTTAPRKRQKKSPPPASKYQGVSYSKDDKKYLAQIEYKNKFHSLGLYKFEADAALAYDIGCKLLWEHKDDIAAGVAEGVPTVASHSDHHRTYNFVWRELYEERIQEEMTNANRIRINVEKSYSKVSEMTEVYLSRIFVAEEKKLRDSLANDQSGDGNEVLELNMDYDDKDTSTDFDVTISAPTMETSTVDLDEGNDGMEGATNYDGIGTSTDFEFAISAPKMDTTDDDVLRDYENGVPSSERNAFSKKHDYYCVEYDKVSKRFMSCISLPKTETRAEMKYWLGAYKLEADAALACDKASVILQIKTPAIFSTTQEYITAKQNELETTNCSDADHMTSLEIATQVFDNIMYQMNNVLAKKWEDYLQATKNRSDFLDSYQASIHEIVTGGGHDQNSGNVRHEEYVDDNLEESKNSTSILSDGQSGGEESDDDASLFSDSSGGEESDDNASLFSDSSQMTPQGCL